MRLLLDSHAVIWAADDPNRLGKRAAAELSDPTNVRLISAATVWEIAIKVGIGKLTISLPFRAWIEQCLNDLVATLLPIGIHHVDAQLLLPHDRGDPFDRMLAAQTLAEGLTLVSTDAVFDLYAVPRIW